MFDSRGIKAKCKRCGKEAPVNEFVLDPVYRLMVCQSCVKERKDREKNAMNVVLEQKKKVEEEKKTVNRPAGWDSEDEYLERAYHQKQSQSVLAERLDAERVRCSCFKCKFRFVYNTKTKTPSACPYCGATVITNFTFK